MDNTRQAIQSEMKKEKEEDIKKAKQKLYDEADVKIKQAEEKLEKKIQSLEKAESKLRRKIKELEEEEKKAIEDLSQQKKSLELDKRSSQSYITRLESEIRQINAASTMSQQTPKF